MNGMVWVWGVVNAVLIMLVIYCNGRGWRGGWALGFAAQCWLILFGVLGVGPWTFVFSTGPAIMFAVNWWLHPRRVARRFAADAEIVRAAVAASHEQPSLVLNARLGVSGEEVGVRMGKFLTDLPLSPRHAPLWPATWIHPWLYDEEPATRPADQEPPPGTAADKVDQVGHFYAYTTGRSDDEPSVSTEQAMAIMAEYGGTPAQYLDHWLRITLHPALSAEKPARDVSGDLSFPVDPDQVDRVQDIFGPPLSNEEAKAKLSEYMTRLMGKPWEGLKESVDRDVATAKLLGFYPAPPPQPGTATDMIASTGHLSSPPADAPSRCMICHTPVPQTELIGHLISHHPDVYDGTPFETWPVDDITEEGGDKP